MPGTGVESEREFGRSTFPHVAMRVRPHRTAPGYRAKALRAFLTILLMLVPEFAGGQTERKDVAIPRVVSLNAADPYLPAFIELDRGLRDALSTGSAAPVGFHAETLDMFRFPQAQIDDEVIRLLQKKYRDLKVDVVVAAAELALRFAETHAADLWPGAVIVFHSVSEERLRTMSLDRRTIGVPVRIDFGATLDLALRLRPATRRIAIVAGAADPDRLNVTRVRAAVERLPDRIDVQYLVGLSLAGTLAAVRTLPPDTVVLYLTVFRDGAGTPLVPREVLTQVAAASTAPVFGVFETYLGEGIVGGSISSYRVQGRRAGELVVRVLNGEDPAAIGVQAPAPPGCIADWRQLRRFGIDERRLPEGCDLRFREIGAWERYRWQILGVLAIFLVQTALVVGLFVNRRRLRQAQTEVQDEYGRRMKSESVASDLRRRLVRFSRERSLGAMATAIAHEINQPLLAIQNYAQAARRRLEQDPGDRPKLIELYAKIEGQAARAGAITQRVRSLVGTGDLQLAAVDLRTAFEEVRRVLASEMEQRGYWIEWAFAEDLPPVTADALQVQLVLINLLRNAMDSVDSAARFEGRLSVAVVPLARTEVQVSVTDRGAGVSPDRVADLFEPLVSGTGGMGLGLAVSRTIIEAHGGRIWHEPNPAGGAVFRFTLRIAGT